MTTNGLQIYIRGRICPEKQSKPHTISTGLSSTLVAYPEATMVSSLFTVAFGLTALTTAFSLPPSHRNTQVGAPLRSSVTAHRRQHNEVKLTSQEYGNDYTINIEIGTPPQNLTVLLDTGSYELWVNPTCKTATFPDDCESLPQYNITDSSTSEFQGTAGSVFYGKGNATLDWFTDVVRIGGESNINEAARPLLDQEKLTGYIIMARPEHIEPNIWCRFRDLRDDQWYPRSEPVYEHYYKCLTPAIRPRQLGRAGPH